MATEILESRREIARILSHLQVHLQDWRASGLDLTRPLPKAPDRPIPDSAPDSASKSGAKPAPEEIRPLSLSGLEKEVGQCTRCGLHQSRTRPVFGEGPAQAQLIFVGEGPGREDDRQGRPFSGEAGELLNKIIRAMGLERQQVYLCHAVKCRGAEHRDPAAEEIAACLPYLKKQIECTRPKAICTLGRIASQALLGESFQLAEQRGRWFAFREIPVMPTYHPAYLLRKPSAKRQVWEDVQKIMKHLGLEGRKNA